jgi:hypothetical protein
MENYSDFDKLTLTLFENKISSFVDNFNGSILKSFHRRLTKKSIPKIYIIKEDNLFLYIGTTTQSLTSRFRYGLNADGKNGYHGYKWKTKESVQLYVWCFESMTKEQIENIEAELAFLIRTKTGKWPLNQNEIHFNNVFDNGKEIAEKMLIHIE